MTLIKYAMMINIMNIRDMHCIVKLYAVVGSLRVDENIKRKEHIRLPLQMTKLGKAPLQNKEPSLPPV